MATPTAIALAARQSPLRVAPYARCRDECVAVILLLRFHRGNWFSMCTSDSTQNKL